MSSATKERASERESECPRDSGEQNTHGKRLEFTMHIHVAQFSSACEIAVGHANSTDKWKRPLGARKTLLIETNSHAVKRLKSESAAGGWGIPPDPHN